MAAGVRGAAPSARQSSHPGACPHAALPAGLELSELDPVFRDDPHPRLDRLRADAPVYLDPAADGARLFLTRHADARAALADRRFSRDKSGAAGRDGGAAAGTLLSMEGEKHRLGRKLIGRAFDGRAAESHRATITAFTDTLLDDIVARGAFDAVEDYAAPLPLLAITHILGLPRVDIARLRRESEDAGILAMLPARTPEQTQRMYEALFGLSARIRTALIERRAEPGDDLVSTLIAAENGALADDDIAPLLLLLLVAGNLTTTDVIANALALLIDNPDQLALLREQPERARNVVEETLRIDPPVSAVARHPCEAADVFGREMPAGSTVKISLLAANHDPGAFPDPHAFRIDRPCKEHVAFGGGAHACPGAALARVEAEIAIARIVARCPNLRRAEAPAPRKQTYGFRGYERLPLRVD